MGSMKRSWGAEGEQALSGLEAGAHAVLIKCTWAPGKAESGREFAGRRAESFYRVNNRKQFCFPLLGRNHKPFHPAAFCVQVCGVQLLAEPPSFLVGSLCLS